MRQLIEFSGVYNLAKPGEWKSTVDLDFIGCMLTLGGGKNDILNRAKRHFHVMNITLPAAASIFQIFGSMTAVAFKEGVVPLEVSQSAQRKLVSMTLDIWQKTKAKMLPTPSKFHYIFVSPTRAHITVPPCNASCCHPGSPPLLGSCRRGGIRIPIPHSRRLLESLRWVPILA